MLTSFRKELKGASSLNVSIHILGYKDDTIFRLMPEKLMDRHVTNRNWCTLGIENVGDGHKFSPTEAQWQANIWLVKFLKKRNNTNEYLIGHHEHTSFQHLLLW